MIWLYVFISVGLLLLVPTAYAGIIGAPYAPTRRSVVRETFKRLNIGPTDVLADLGAGDGGILRLAAKHGANAFGYELSPIMWLIGWLLSLRQSKIKFYFGNFYKKKLPVETTIVFAFLMPKIMPRIRKYLADQTLPHGKYFLSYIFPLAGDLPPLMVVNVNNGGSIYVYDLKSLTRSADIKDDQANVED